MQTVIETPTFIQAARRVGMSEAEVLALVDFLATTPEAGDPMQSTGGCRKVRIAGRGKGKSGGYRTVHYNGADDVPVLLLVVMDKGDRDNLNQAERNELRQLMQTYETEYRAGVRGKVTTLAEGA